LKIPEKKKNLKKRFLAPSPIPRPLGKKVKEAFVTPKLIFWENFFWLPKFVSAIFVRPAPAPGLSTWSSLYYEKGLNS